MPMLNIFEISTILAKKEWFLYIAPLSHTFNLFPATGLIIACEQNLKSVNKLLWCLLAGKTVQVQFNLLL